MKKIIFSVFVLFISAGIVCAHPAKSVDVTVKGEQLTIVADHPVNDTKAHFITYFKVFLNGKEIIRQDYGFQKGSTQTATYLLPLLKKGDVIKAEAECNKFGETVKEIIVK